MFCYVILTESQLQSSLEMMREQLLSNETLSRSVNVSRMWFDNMTLYINLLQDFHDRLGSEIIQVHACSFEGVLVYIYFIFYSSIKFFKTNFASI